MLTFQRLSREEAESETVRKKNTDKSAEGAGKDPSPGCGLARRWRPVSGACTYTS